ncbi:pectate lyase family protein [Phytohabitans sp. LJ34]|uniref:pectate lyase family protein n=1 Tax=Phytohabitans sp. LJ34 TaxID=3452217 RepID=UPI003F8C9900
MTRKALLAAAVVAALVFAGVHAAHAATLFSADFTGGASGWTRSGGSWSVVTDGSAVYRQSGTGSDARALAGSSSWSDYTVEARVKPTGFNGTARHAGIIARAQSTSGYYYLALTNAGEVRLGRRGSGGHTTLAAAPATAALDTWHRLRLEATGTTLRGFLNGQLVATATDSAYASGSVGLATYYASASFDDVLVTDAAGPTPTTPTPGVTTSPPPQPLPGQPDGHATGTTGGAGGPTVTVTTAAELAQYAGANTPYVIRVAGRIAVDDMVTVVANKSIIGVGSTAEITGGGLQLGTTTRPGDNVIIRNITFRDASDDSISVHNGSHHVWIDHNDFYPGFDGSVDVKRRSTNVTVSWNRFHATDKSMLLGHSDTFPDDIGYLKVTYHHNYFDGSNQRHPRVRFGEPVHVYNNYYRGIGLYGVASTENAGVLVEANYFEDVAFPCHSVSGYADSAPGRLAERGNVFVRSGPCESGGAVADPRAYYAYTPDSASAVPALVTAGAGAGRIS